MKAGIRHTIVRFISRMKRESILYIGGSDTLPPPLTKEEERSLMENMQTSNEQAVRARG